MELSQFIQFIYFRSIEPEIRQFATSGQASISFDKKTKQKMYFGRLKYTEIHQRVPNSAMILK